jgi:DNA-binding NarL/FixJ family response regulator
MIKILIADDHPIVRQGFKQVLSDTPDLVVADEAGNGQEVLSLVSKKDYDVILLDISMPGKNGLEVLKELKVVSPKTPVLILSIYPEEQYAIRAEELISAIRKVSRGGKYVSSSLAEKIAYQLDGDSEKAPHETLSDREYQILLMIASGKTVSDIAGEMCLSVKTVSTYRSRIIDKMKLKNNAELTTYAIRNKLVE